MNLKLVRTAIPDSPTIFLEFVAPDIGTAKNRRNCGIGDDPVSRDRTKSDLARLAFETQDVHPLPFVLDHNFTNAVAFVGSANQSCHECMTVNSKFAGKATPG